MRTIAIINQKGGCGKTTISVNLAATLAGRGHRTLLVDMDPQSHCALALAVPESQIRGGIEDVLLAGPGGSPMLSDIVWQVSRDLDLAPSTVALAGVEHQLLAAGTAPDRDRRLTEALIAAGRDYDYCVIDCPPAVGLLTFNALRAAGQVLVPVETGYFALQAAIRQQKTIDALAQQAGHHVSFHVLATMVDRQAKLSRQILTQMQQQFEQQLARPMIHLSHKLREAASFGQPIAEYDPTCQASRDFEQLADWVASHPPARPLDQLAALPASSAPANPTGTVSRAAELVERARALAARTAARQPQAG